MKSDHGVFQEESPTTRTGVSQKETSRSRSAVATGNKGRVSISAAERRQFIAEAAYYRAEARGFAPNGEIDDWLAAEEEVDRSLLRH